MRRQWPATITFSLVLCSAPVAARAQNDATATIIHIANAYTLVPNIARLTSS